jgi:cell division protein FtsQ
LRPLAEDTFRFEFSENDGTQNSSGGSLSGDSWISLAQKNADRAASAGFVLSMAFLAAAAIYGLSLSDTAKPYILEAAAIADQAAYDAGYSIKGYRILGLKNAPEETVLEALGLPYKNTSLFYDAAAARRRLLAVGWVETAEVRRILPSRLEIAVSERTPFARFEDEAQKIFAIDREGHILGAADSRFETLPLFAGDDAPSSAAAFEDAFSAYPALKARIRRAELIAGRFWLVALDNGPKLKLPRKPARLALERLDSLLANPKVVEMGLETIDLRLANRTILQLREPTLANRDKAIALLTAAGQGAPAQHRMRAS